MLRWSLAFIALAVLVAPGCGGTSRVNPNEEPVVATAWGHADLQGASQKLADDFAAWAKAQNSRTKPVIYIARCVNKTDQHIDTKNVTDRLRILLLKSGLVSFSAVNEAQEEMLKQLRFQQGALVAPATAKAMGKQIGADFFLFGELTSITEEAGRKKGVYYKLTLNLVNIETGLIPWADDADFQKVQTRGIFGL